MKNTPYAFIFFGRSGSGKGTQAHLLTQYLQEQGDRKVIYVETGQRFREFAQEDSYTSQLTKHVMETGGLMPAFMPIWIWTESLIKEFTGEEHLVLDGLSRRERESPILDSALQFYGFEKPIVVYLNVSRERAFEHLKKRNRPDDTDEYISERLDWFDESVKPAMDYFRDNLGCLFLDVDGEQGIKAVQDEIIEKAGLK